MPCRSADVTPKACCLVVVINLLRAAASYFLARHARKARKQRASGQADEEAAGEEMPPREDGNSSHRGVELDAQQRDGAGSPWKRGVRGEGDAEGLDNSSSDSCSEDDDDDDEDDGRGARQQESTGEERGERSGEAGGGRAHGTEQAPTSGEFRDESLTPHWSVREALSSEAERARWMGQLGQLAARCVDTCGPLMSARDVGVSVIAFNTVEVRGVEGREGTGKEGRWSEKEDGAVSLQGS